MLFEWMTIAYWKHKTALCLLVVITVVYFVKAIEEIAILGIINFELYMHNERHIPSGNSTYPEFLSERHYLTNTTSVLQTSSTFPWYNKEERKSFKKLHELCPVVAMMFGGIFSDKYGGNRVVATGMIVSSLVMSMCYLAVLKNEFVFLAMVIVRRVSGAVSWVAAISLIGQVTLHDERTMFVSFIYIGYSLGYYLGYLVSSLDVRWEYLCECSAFVVFVTAVWWSMIYKRPRFPEVCRLKRIPRKQFLTSGSLYVGCLLIFYDYLSFDLCRHSQVEYFTYCHWKQDFLKDVLQTAKLLGIIVGFLLCGACSDYLIYKEVASVIDVRRGFIIASLVLVFLVLAITSLLKRNELVLLTKIIALNFIWTLCCNTAVATIIDFSPSCAGTVSGITYTFVLLLRYILVQPLSLVFLPAYPNGNKNSWSLLYFTLACLGLLSSLSFLCFKFKPLLLPIGNSSQNRSRANQASADNEDSWGIPVYNEEPNQGINPSSSKL